MEEEEDGASMDKKITKIQPNTTAPEKSLIISGNLYSWGEEERAIPLKKRRVILYRPTKEEVEEGEIIEESGFGGNHHQADREIRIAINTANDAEKRKKNKEESRGRVRERCTFSDGKGWRCGKPAQNTDFVESSLRRRSTDFQYLSSFKKKKKSLGSYSGGALTVGGERRCKRDGGKGWRCDQPAEEGSIYCEYHILQRSHIMMRKKKKKKKKKKKNYHYYDEGNDFNGVVKARSMANLLGNCSARVRGSALHL